MMVSIFVEKWIPMKPTVTIINLGGPQNTEEIEAFLKDLFLDPYLFDLPLWEPLRRILARFIAKKRAPKVAVTYSSMGFGGGSPLVAETKKQASAIATALSQATGQEWESRIAMTCGFPNLRDLSIAELTPSKNNIIIPLFPQFSRSTTLSVSKIIESITKDCPMGRIGWVEPFARDDRFSDVTANLILNFLQGKLDKKNFIHLPSAEEVKDWQNLDLVFSAHGIPMRLIKKGDKYVDEIFDSVQSIESKLRKKGFLGRVHISFQSRVGPAKWTEPNTKTIMKELGSQKARIAVYPISFVGDHLETLEEIGVELRDLAMDAGASEYIRIPAPGTYPDFIDFMKDLALESREKAPMTECICQKLGGEKPIANCLS